jgi:RNA polymerase sigma-70 factor (ECF subfamily)
MTAAFEWQASHQAELRASILVKWRGFSPQDWEDVRQDLVLDCLRRIPRFDPTRGEWPAFVRGVMYNQSTVLLSRRRRHLRREILAGDLVLLDRKTSTHFGYVMENLVLHDSTASLQLQIDVARVLRGLPGPLRTVAKLLSEVTVTEICVITGRSRSWVYRMAQKIREAFMSAGFRPKSVLSKRTRRGTRSHSAGAKAVPEKFCDSSIMDMLPPPIRQED